MLPYKFFKITKKHFVNFQKAFPPKNSQKVSQFSKSILTQEHLIFKLILLDQHISCPSQVIKKSYTTKRKSYISNNKKMSQQEFSSRTSGNYCYIVYKWEKQALK